jgi:hypothetical protein
MARYKSLNDLNNDRVFDGEWRKKTEKEKEKDGENIEKIKKFLLSTCRNNSKMQQNLLHANFEGLKNYGIFDRLIVVDGEGSYIAGQDYSTEINYIKKLIVREV